MDDPHHLLRHFLAALAYRTQKALRGAPASFAAFRAGDKVRTPHELVRHMTSVLGYARTFFTGGKYRPEPLPTFDDEVRRFHEVLADLSGHLEGGAPLQSITPEQLLQGPLADAMTHAGQVRALVLRQVSGMMVVGGGIGIAGALGVGRAAGSLLYGLAGHDPVVFVLAAALLMLVALGAGYVPARRASLVDPVRALRYE